MHRTATTLLFLFLSGVPALAQRQRCGTPELVPGGLGVAPSDCGYSTNSPQPQYDPSCYYDIQVVFHVIQSSSGAGFLSASTIQEQIDVLNEDFQALPGSPGAPGTDARIRFHLATLDPGGGPTTGITYSTNDSWFQDSGNYWSPLAWDTNRYMNVYTNAVPCCYGYVSGFPSEGIAGQASDRVVLWWEAVGRQPTTGWPLNMGRTATHEVGHYLGLYHTFEGGCGSASACSSTGDLICDTARESGANYGCPGAASSCSSPDPIHNYMDYTDDPCLWEFTPEQVNRTRCTLEHWRPTLYKACLAEVGTNYCTSTPNSGGSAATISGSGSASIASNDLVLQAESAVASTMGLFFYGLSQAQTPFGEGFLCVGSPIYRLAPPQASDGQGSAQKALDLTQPPLGSGNGMVTTGSTANFQYWYRDPQGGGSGFNLSNGLSVTFVL
jgi:hypothetical protein